MGKKKRPSTDSGGKPQAAPPFRPLEGQIKKLAEEKRAKERAKAPATRAASTPPPAPRASTLTPDEQRELAAMERDPSHDDEFFFRRLMSGVVPLAKDTRGRATATVAPKRRPVVAGTPRPDPDQEVREHLMQLVEGATRFEVTDDGVRLEGRRIDLDTGTWRRVRRGELPIDARIDLHGKSAVDAREALEAFLREKRSRRDRMVLVVHGRGEHSPAGIGVLRGEISAWLAQGRASQHVAAFATAGGDDGGAGALYVLLRP